MQVLVTCLCRNLQGTTGRILTHASNVKSGSGHCGSWGFLQTQKKTDATVVVAIAEQILCIYIYTHYAMLCYVLLCYAILYYTILYYTILYYTILYYTILYYTMLCYAMLCYAILYYTILYYTILYYTILYYTILCYTMLYYTILYYTILYYTILYYTILYYTILYYTILYYTILYYILYYTILYYTVSSSIPTILASHRDRKGRCKAQILLTVYLQLPNDCRFPVMSQRQGALETRAAGCHMLPRISSMNWTALTSAASSSWATNTRHPPSKNKQQRVTKSTQTQELPNTGVPILYTEKIRCNPQNRSPQMGTHKFWKHTSQGRHRRPPWLGLWDRKEMPRGPNMSCGQKLLTWSLIAPL